MANPFDAVKRSIFGKVRDVFAEPATWTPSDGLPLPDGSLTYVGNVLFKHPASEFELSGMEFDVQHYYMEYLADQFPGLVDRVKSRSSNGFEIININGRDYQAHHVVEMRDGDVHRIKLTPAQVQLEVTNPRP